MKCVKCYRTDCARGWYQVARGCDGRYFMREYGFNGYGVGFTPWRLLGKIRAVDSASSKSARLVKFENSTVYISLKRIYFDCGYRLPN